MSGETGKTLIALIEKAMNDLEISTAEYKEIMAAAGADHTEDAREQALLAELHSMLSNGTIKRVAR